MKSKSFRPRKSSQVNLEGWEGIVKVQRELSAPHRSMLIYDERHRILMETIVTPDIARWFGIGYKIFAKAKVENGRLRLLHRVAFQDW